MSWTYEQATGRISRDGMQVATGYAGLGEGKNNPAMEKVKNMGPIPRGSWTIGTPHDTPDHGPFVMRLSPADGTVTFGRDGFLIHGDSIAKPGTASHGCIIFPRTVRNQIAASGDKALEVI